MRCSSCEPLLDRYLEGTLAPREMLRMRAHVEGCAHCTSLLAELRVIDALLATTKPIELAPNFTFAVMAEVRDAQMHAVRRVAIWIPLTSYIVVAWLALTGAFIAFGTHNPFLDALRGAVTSAFAQASTALSVLTHSVGPSAPFVVGGVVMLLAVDALLAFGVLMLYRAIRARTHRSEAL